MGTALASAGASATPAASESPAGSGEAAGTDPDEAELTQHRVIFSSTARPLPPEQLSFTGYMGGLWHIEYGFNEHFSAGVVTNLPIALVGVAPTLRTQMQLSDSVAIGAGAAVGVSTSYLDSYSFGFFGYGVNGVVTYSSGDRRHLLNFSATAAKVGFHEEGYQELLEELLVIPTLGYSYRLNSKWQLAAEVSNPFFAMSVDLYGPGHLWLISYGGRYHGDVLLCDLGFMLPVQEDFTENVWKYLPLGVPYFSVGFAL